MPALDYHALLPEIILASALVAVLVVDILYSILDPRVRLAETR